VWKEFRSGKAFSNCSRLKTNGEPAAAEEHATVTAVSTRTSTVFRQRRAVRGIAG